MLRSMPAITYVLLLALCGALVYLLASPRPRNAQIARLGELTFACAMFWFAYQLGTAAAHALFHN
jgi:hypothetical protein